MDRTSRWTRTRPRMVGPRTAGSWSSSSPNFFSRSSRAPSLSGLFSFLAQRRERLGQVLGRGSLRADAPALARMKKSENAGVQHLAGSRNASHRTISAPVDTVADHGVARRGEVHSDLMRSAGFELHPHEGGLPESFEHAIPCHRAAA